MSRRVRLQPIFLIFTCITLIVVLVYTYFFTIKLPWIGLSFSPLDGTITVTDPSNPAQAAFVKPGDQVLKVGGIPFLDYAMGSRPELSSFVNEEGMLTLLLGRGNSTIQVEWLVTPLTTEQTIFRLLHLSSPFSFLFFSLVIILFLRPVDNRYALFVLAYNLTALWTAGLVVMPYNIAYSPLLTRAVLWMCIPVYLHFSWEFPQPLKEIPRAVPAGLYAVGGIFVLAEAARWLPVDAYLYGILLSVAGSIVLLLMHVFTHPQQVRDIRLIGIVLALVLLPYLIGILFTRSAGHPVLINLVIFTLPGAPLTILYIVLRRRLGGLELRINQALTLFLFFLALVTVARVAILPLDLQQPLPDGPIYIMMAVVFSGLAGALVYPAFSRWMQQGLLRIPLLPDKMLHVYAGRITTSLEEDRLRSVLCKEIFPSLLVREGALLQLNEHLQPVPVALCGIEPEMLPRPEDVPSLLASAGRYRPVDLETGLQDRCHWVRLALTLSVEGRPIGLCLLGRRDPDDFFPMTEIPALQSLMDQTALAMYNIEQAERLRNLHKANIARVENERMALALELHDQVLGQMALVAMNAQSGFSSGQFEMAYQTAADHIRSIINGLRPTMLNYGLREAFKELVDEILSQTAAPPVFDIRIPESEARYPGEMEMHLYRIVQQASQNAILHGKPEHIIVSGLLKPDLVEIIIEDDGAGFAISETPDLTGLLNQRHFGLAGIYERASLIGATVRIESQPGKGTRVCLKWTGAPMPV